MPDYLIIGGSAGGIGAVEAIREVDPAGNITVISEEPFPPYSRPMISDLVSGEATLEKMKYRSDDFWETNKTHVLTGKAVELNPTQRCVELENGRKIRYRELLIATGGQPFIPPIEGADRDGVFTFTTITDAEHLALRAKDATNAVIIGGGLIGVSVAEALSKCGVEVTIVELKDRILNLILDELAASIVEGVLESVGVTIVTGQTVRRIQGKNAHRNAVGGVVLSNDKTIPSDLVVIAIGAVPRTELVKETGVKINRGILVDRHMRTNVSHVYACGDVAEAYDFILNEGRVHPFWPLAHLGGRVAGYNMAGKKTEYPGGTSMSAVKCFELPIISVGITNPPEDNGYEVLTHLADDAKRYRKVILKNERVMGMTLVNEIARAGTLFYLLRTQVNVRAFKQHLVSENFNLAVLPLPVRKRLLLEGLEWTV